MQVTTNITLDFTKETYPVKVFAKEGDQETRFVRIQPLNNGTVMTLEAGISAKFQATKPDNTTVLDNCTISSGYIIAELTAQVLAVPGIVVAEIGLYKGTQLLSTQTFYVDVKPAAYDENAVVSSDEFNALVDALAQAQHFEDITPRDYLNVSVAVADWSLEGTPTYADYPYVAVIDIADAVADDIPELVPDMDAQADCLLCPLANATAGHVSIYASAIPVNDYTFIRITLRKENVQT